MRKALLSLLALLAVALPTKCTDIGKDGFNYYKDYLRGRADDIGAEGPEEDRMIYFYRTPIAMNPSYLPALELEYRKRAGNAFKNHMLSKEILDTGAAKRSSKTALSFLMQAKHPYDAADIPEDKISEVAFNK